MWDLGTSKRLRLRTDPTLPLHRRHSCWLRQYAFNKSRLSKLQKVYFRGVLIVVVVGYLESFILKYIVGRV